MTGLLAYVKKGTALIILLIGATMLFADDPTLNITVTRDLGNHKFEGFDDYKAGVKYDGPFHGSTRILYENLNTKKMGTGVARKMLIVINDDLYPQIESSLTVYINDLQRDGYNVFVETQVNNNDPHSLRELLRSYYDTYQIEGALFIGDLSVAWFEIDNDFNKYGYASFPCDYYYMDLDGNWHDDDDNDIFESNDGDTAPEIWLGRLNANKMSYHGFDEVSALQNYFIKNHRYRMGSLRLQDHALAYIEDDWEYSGFDKEVKIAYEDTDVKKGEDRLSYYYGDYVSESSGNSFEHVLLAAHSWSSGHSVSNSTFVSKQIEEKQVEALFYNLFCCSNSRFTESDYMGGWYIFQRKYGLVSVGSTKTGSMLAFGDYFTPLSEGKTFGEAFKKWSENHYTSSPDWYYGLVINGDPTLKLSRFMELGDADTPPQISIKNLQNFDVVSGVVNIKTDVNDDNGIKKVQFFVNNNFIEETSRFPYNFRWDSTLSENGEHQLMARAYDTANQVTEHRIRIKVNNNDTIINENLAATATVEATSVYSSDYPVTALTDDNGETTWFSKLLSDNNDRQMIMLYFNEETKFNRISIDWNGTFYPQNFKVFSEGDDVNYMVARTRGTTGEQMLKFETVKAKGIIMIMESRNDNYYGINEIKVFTADDSTSSDENPTVTILSPGDGDVLQGTVTISIDADDDNGVKLVTFCVGDFVCQQLQEYPYRDQLDTTGFADGEYTVKAEVTDTAGNITTDTITVRIQNTVDEAEQNLAVGKYTYSNSSSGNWQYSVEYVNDGDPKTAWQSEVIGTDNVYQYVVVDMGREVEASSVVLQWGQGQNWPRRYRITCLKDGTGQQWQTLYNVRDGSPGERRIDFEKVKARYFAFVCEANNTKYLQLHEFKVLK